MQPSQANNQNPAQPNNVNNAEDRSKDEKKEEKKDEKKDEKESLTSKPSDVAEVKLNETTQKKKHKHARPTKISDGSDSSSIKSQVNEVKGPLSVVKQPPGTVLHEVQIPVQNAPTVKARHNAGALGSPRSSGSSKVEDAQAKHVGFQEPLPPNRKSPPTPNQPTVLRSTNPHHIEQSAELPIMASHNTDQLAVPPVKTFQSNAAQKIDADKATESPKKLSLTPHYAETSSPTKLSEPSKAPPGLSQPIAEYANFQAMAGVSNAMGPHVEPALAEKENKTNERSKLIVENISMNECISEQTLYARATKKLPVEGPLSIDNLEDFLKKSKKDFEHYYHKKPVSGLHLTDFNIIRTIGVGAFGKVILVEFKRDKTLYAVKIIEKVGVVKRNHVRYVSNEKRILQALNFPFVINLKYFFTDTYCLYFVMPFISGGNFYKHMKVCRLKKEPEARFYTAQLVLALEYLHHLGLIHRDVKTENIMIDSNGYLKLVDFGQCIRCCGSDKTWTFTGTPEYMAPEIIVGKGYDCAVDWWALGVITFEMCAGFRPFKNESSRKLQLLILCNQYTMPSTFSRSLKKLIEGLLVIEPKKRLANSSKKASLIKKHEWFKGLDWLALLNRTMEAPFIPNLTKSSIIPNSAVIKDQEKLNKP